MTEPVPFETQMAALRTSFAKRARHESEELRLLAERPEEGDANREKICKIAHNLAGAAAIFGMPEVSSQAALLEEAILAGAEPADISSQSLALVEKLTEISATQTS